MNKNLAGEHHMLVILNRLILFTVLLCTSNVFAADGVTVIYPDWFKQSFYELPADLQDAKKAGKNGIMVFFSTKTCSYCKAIIEKTFRQEDIVKQLRAKYDVIGLEVLSDTEVVDAKGKTLWAKDFAVQSKAKFTPTMIFYDTSGNMQLRLVGYQSPEKFRGALSYLEGKYYTHMNFREYLLQQQSESKTTAQQQTPLNLERLNGSDKPLLVVFETDVCAKCNQLRVMLKAPVLKNDIQKYNVVYVNTGDSTSNITTPGGKKQSGKSWANQLGLIHSPAMLFFNEQGKEVLRVDTDILIDEFGKDVAADNTHILDNLRGRLHFVLQKGYITLPQYQRWRAQQAKKESQ